jgi:flagellar basal body-associated protein FliL
MTAMPFSTDVDLTIAGPGASPDPRGRQSAASNGKTKDKEPKKSKKKLVIGVVVVLALVGFKEKGMFIKPHYSASHPAPNGQVYALPTSSPFTVTTSDGHLVQTNVALQLTTVASTKKLTSDEPAIEAVVVNVLGGSTYPDLLSSAGRTAAAGQILKGIQSVLGPVDGSVQLSQVFFTGTFVLQ